MTQLKVTICGLGLLALIGQSAHAKNLGVLSQDQLPKNLVTATELAANPPDTELRNSNSQNLRSDARGGGNSSGRGRGHGGGYGRGYGYGYYYPSYYYPYYYYPYYYPYSTYYLNDEGDTESTNLPASPSSSLSSSSAPGVCFSSDSTGHWFAHADAASNAASAQETANRECLASGANCSQNLGCAIASPTR